MSLPVSKASQKKEFADPFSLGSWISLGAWGLLVQVKVEGDKTQDKYRFSAFSRQPVLTELHKQIHFHDLHLKASLLPLVTMTDKSGSQVTEKFVTINSQKSSLVIWTTITGKSKLQLSSAAASSFYLDIIICFCNLFLFPFLQNLINCNEFTLPPRRKKTNLVPYAEKRRKSLNNGRVAILFKD